MIFIIIDEPRALRTLYPRTSCSPWLFANMFSRTPGECVMYLYSKKLLGRKNLYWFVLGAAILIPLVMVCTILCLLDIPHWPMWR